ncbi:hypothetical protein C8R46DRAFT_1117456 [Mycena filopes]|nr:hypothetical protein C8R46DRAFT_1117456 [Mycena filopes]
MDQKPPMQGGNRALLLNHGENDRLEAQLERIRQRDDVERLLTESQVKLAESQVKVANLEGEVRRQANRIEELEARLALSQQVQPPAPPKPKLVAPSQEIIEISDSEDNEHGRSTSRQLTLGLETIEQHQHERHVMDFVDLTHSVDTEAPSSSTRPTSGRFKRARPVSPPLPEDSVAAIVEDGATPRISPRRSTVSLNSNSTTVRKVSPVAEPPTKRLKKIIKAEPLQDVATLFLANIPNLHIDPQASDKSFSRNFLERHYKFTSWRFVGTFTLQNATTPRRDAFFPQDYLNPFLPQAPGAAGLIFSSRSPMEIVEDPAAPAPPWALFLRGPKEALWRYMGDYRNRCCGSLTAAQFASLSRKVQLAWGDRAMSKKTEVFASMCREGSFVAGDEVEAREKKMIMEQKKGEPLRTLPLKAADIVEALRCDDETMVINIIRLECVAYDHAFAAELAQRQLEAEKEPSEPARPRSAKKGKGKGKAKAKAKQQPKADSGDESGSAFAPESEADSDGGYNSPRPRRQRRNRKPSPQLGSPAPPAQARSPSRSQTPKLGWDDILSEMSEISE